ETAARVYRGDIYAQAARSLIDDGLMAASDFPDFTGENFERPFQGKLIDGVPFTPREPNAYIDRFEIGLKADQTPGGRTQMSSFTGKLSQSIDFSRRQGLDAFTISSMISAGR